MDYFHETYRKLYVRVDAAWLALPLSARGLGDELLKYADDEGRIALGGAEPGEAIATMLSAKPNERERVTEDVKALLGGRKPFLLRDGDELVIRTFQRAQNPSKGAERQRRWRERQAALRETSRETGAETSPRDDFVTSPPGLPSGRPSLLSNTSTKSQDLSGLAKTCKPSRTRERAPARQAATGGGGRSSGGRE